MKPDGLCDNRCICGHDQGAHLDDARACRRGHYGPGGRYVGGGCPCLGFRSASVDRPPEMFAEFTGPVDAKKARDRSPGPSLPRNP